MEIFLFLHSESFREVKRLKRPRTSESQARKDGPKSCELASVDLASADDLDCAAYCEVVIEDLDISAMKRSLGRRAFRRSVSDAALGTFRCVLRYKAERAGTTLVVADRWYASSQIHHGCGCRLIAPTRQRHSSAP